ncbi:MAG TPA: regulatory protein RecX [Bacteroidales bacterium]|nr:regulatory protein RecX [Bacteroidales bacterium]
MTVTDSQKQSETNKADLWRTGLNKAMKLCSEREICIREISDKCSSWGIGKDDTDRIIKILLDEKFIDENRYASAYVRDKFKYNKWGKAKIAAGLRMKGVPREIISQSLGLLDDENYKRLLESLLASQRKKIKAKNQYDLKAKLMRYGLSKGFESALLYEILGEEV